MPTASPNADHRQPSTRSRLARPPARLALADGSVFYGEAFGAGVAVGDPPVSVEAEVVFNTAMGGYQESLTDPSYRGQVLVQTATMIGNTGANPEDMESGRIHAAGLVVRELARRHSNFRAAESLSEFLVRFGVLGIAGVDTRAITRRLRESGSMPGVITDDPGPSDAELVARARSAHGMAGQNLVPLVGCASAEPWDEPLGVWSTVESSAGSRSRGSGLRVAAIDCGAKHNILRHLTDRGCAVTRIPHDIGADGLAKLFDPAAPERYHGLFLSNGPGDPSAVDRLIATLRSVLDRERTLPVFGICLGHQLLALAAGAKTYKLKFGHRGANQPVLATERGRVEITSQNHGFAVDASSLEAVGGVATHTHLNDGTLAGFRLEGRPVFAVQYHPEASPGPHDAAELFDRFVEAMRSAAVG